MAKKLVFRIISSIIGLYIADYLVNGFEIRDGIKALLIGGTLLGAAIFFIKPIFKIISLPLRIITFGLFNFVINLFLVWLVIDVIMWQYMEIRGLIALFWVTLIIWIINHIFSKIS